MKLRPKAFLGEKDFQAMVDYKATAICHKIERTEMFDQQSHGYLNQDGRPTVLLNMNPKIDLCFN